MRTEDLLAAMVADAAPVRRLRPPLVRAALWLGLSVLAIAAVVGVTGFRPDLAERLGRSWEVAQLAAAGVTGALAAIAAFHLALPDRSDAWALLPLPGFAVWVASLGWGCVADFLRLGPEGLTLGTSWGCLGFILGLSVPLGGAMLVALRHAAPIRPVPTAATGVLSVAMLASVGLSLVHHLDAAVMVLVWHVGAVLVAVALSAGLSRPTFRVARRLSAAFA
ncbi:NrsF family protein [Elioraea sp.]|uniref:NrsF family protein n=1 Tax=Elioraea sp. TaxID=2185103 RepID=UPI00307CDCA5